MALNAFLKTIISVDSINSLALCPSFLLDEVHLGGDCDLGWCATWSIVKTLPLHTSFIAKIVLLRTVYNGQFLVEVAFFCQISTRS